MSAVARHLTNTASFAVNLLPENHINTYDFADRMPNAAYKDLVVILGCICAHAESDPELKQAIDNVMRNGDE